MNKVTVKKEELLAILKENREKHQEKYELAFDGYKQTAIELLEDHLKWFKEGVKTTLRWTEHPPENHTNEYDKAIKMLEMSIDDEIELEDHLFQQYVMDDWNWKQGWVASNNAYVTKSLHG